MKTETKIMPPKIVKAPDGCKYYLTPGKEYKVESILAYNERYGFCFAITDDEGDENISSERDGEHINGQDWIIVEREKESE